MTRKDIAVKILTMVVERKIRAAFDEFIADDFKHHNQYFKGDRQSLMLAMEESAEKKPDKKFEIKKIYEDGETIITHSLVKQSPEDLGSVVVHILRVGKHGKIQELWDLGQPLMQNSPNENGPF